MKSKKLLILVLVVIAGIIAILFVVLKIGQPQLTEEDRRAEQLILSYIEAKGLNIKPGTDEYAQLMKGILLGEHPELTGEYSTFVTSEEDRNLILNYAAAHMNTGKKDDYIEPGVDEAIPTPSEPTK